MSNRPKNGFSARIVNAGFIHTVPYWQYPLASSPTWRFYWNRDPGAWIISGGEKVALTPDVAVLIPPQTPFSTGSENSFSHFYIHFVLLENITVKKQIRKFAADEIILPYISGNIAGFSERQLNWAAAAVVNSALLLMPEESFLPEFESDCNSIFDKVVQIIDDDPGFAGNCRELAGLCGTSCNTLQRLFRKATGMSVKKWLSNRRMEYAVQLLIYNNCSIKETAYRLGFADRYHFSKVFKQYFGISPAQFIHCGGLPLP